MKTLKTFLVVALASVCFSASAQTKKVVDRVDQRTVQEFDHQDKTDHFKKHAFITLQGGAQYTLGEAKFKDLISPNVQLGIGYQFNPWFAARIQANGWQSKGGWNNGINNTYKFKYVAPGIDLMFDLTNAFGGWNPNRFLSVVAFIGGGANIAWDNGEVNDIAKRIQNVVPYNLEYLWDGTKVRPFGRGGLQLGFRLSDAVSLLIEGNANILSDKYNSKNADNPDWYFNALAGLRINLGKTRATETKDVYRNKYPEAKVVVSGYADKGTGNERINARLAAQRADVVVNTLKKDYGIAENRITYDSYGDKVQPFEENDLNRVSICIAE